MAYRDDKGPGLANMLSDFFIMHWCNQDHQVLSECTSAYA